MSLKKIQHYVWLSMKMIILALIKRISHTLTP